MKRLLAWLSGALGGVAVYRLLQRQRATADVPEPPDSGPDPRAAELRAKLDESRPLVEEQATFDSAETPVDEADPEERRRRVHEQARSAVDKMRGSGSEEPT